MQENPLWKQIEAYIQNNREALDVDRPSDDLWNRISRELHQEVPRRAWYQNNVLWRAAAAIALIAVLSYLWVARLSDGNTQGVITDINSQESPDVLSQGTPTDWEEVGSPYQAPIDSLEQLPGAAQAPLQAVDHSLDSLQKAGPPNETRIGRYQELMQRKEMLLRQATQQ